MGRKEEIDIICIPKDSEKVESQHALFGAKRLITICVVFVAVSPVGISLDCVNCSRAPTVQRVSNRASVTVNEKPTRIWFLDLMFCLFVCFDFSLTIKEIKWTLSPFPPGVQVAIIFLFEKRLSIFHKDIVSNLSNNIFCNSYSNIYQRVDSFEIK